VFFQQTDNRGRFVFETNRRVSTVPSRVVTNTFDALNEKKMKTVQDQNVKTGQFETRVELDTIC